MGKVPVTNNQQQNLKEDDKLYKWLRLLGFGLVAYFSLSYFLFFSERISAESLFTMLQIGSYVGMGTAFVAVLAAISIAHEKKRTINT